MGEFFGARFSEAFTLEIDDFVVQVGVVEALDLDVLVLSEPDLHVTSSSVPWAWHALPA
ncbi:MAG: hypothetical protein LBU50_03555 [Cellulomonas sp.]|nr:hypothetical protein [Cellulomonas sp.]